MCGHAGARKQNSTARSKGMGREKISRISTKKEEKELVSKMTQKIKRKDGKKSDQTHEERKANNKYLSLDILRVHLIRGTYSVPGEVHAFAFSSPVIV